MSHGGASFAFTRESFTFRESGDFGPPLALAALPICIHGLSICIG